MADDADEVFIVYTIERSQEAHAVPPQIELSQSCKSGETAVDHQGFHHVTYGKLQGSQLCEATQWLQSGAGPRAAARKVEVQPLKAGKMLENMHIMCRVEKQGGRIFQAQAQAEQVWCGSKHMHSANLKALRVTTFAGDSKAQTHHTLSVPCQPADDLQPQTSSAYRASFSCLKQLQFRVPVVHVVHTQRHLFLLNNGNIRESKAL